MFNGLLFSTPSKIIRKDEQLRMTQMKKYLIILIAASFGIHIINQLELDYLYFRVEYLP